MNLDPLTNTKKNALILGAFALVTTLLIAITYLGTKDTIAQQQQRMLLKVINDVVPVDSFNNDIQHNCAVLPVDAQLGYGSDLKVYRGYTQFDDVKLNQSEQATLTSVAIETIAPDGYSGDIRIIVGISGKYLRTVTGVRVLAHKETPGLGDKIDLRINDWILSFNQQIYVPGREDNWAVKKEGGQFDAFTGATITPRAVVNAVLNAMLYVQAHQRDIALAQNQCALISAQDGADTQGVAHE